MQHHNDGTHVHVRKCQDSPTDLSAMPTSLEVQRQNPQAR